MTGDDSTFDFCALLGRCQVVPRDERAWQEFVQRYDARAFAIARRTLRGLGQVGDVDSQAADLRMDLWVRLVRDEHAGLRRFEGRTESALLAHFARTMRNLAIDQIRKSAAVRRPREVGLSEIEFDALLNRLQDPTADPMRDAEFALLQGRVLGVLRRNWVHSLNCDRDIAICMLSWFERLSAERISAIKGFGLSRGGVEKVLGRGLALLRANLADRPEQRGPGK